MSILVNKILLLKFGFLIMPQIVLRLIFYIISVNTKSHENITFVKAQKNIPEKMQHLVN